MNLRFSAWTLLLALSLGGLAASHASLARDAQAVEFQHQDFSGDFHAVQGLRIASCVQQVKPEFNSRQERFPRWKTTLLSGTSAHTEFRLAPLAEENAHSQPTSGATLEEEDGVFLLRIPLPDTPGVSQVIPLWKSSECRESQLIPGDNFLLYLGASENCLIQLVEGEGFLLPINAEGQFKLLIQQEDGHYFEQFTGDLPKLPQFQSLQNPITYTAAFDGETLALAGLPLHLDAPPAADGFSLAIYQGEALRYAGHFSNTLVREPDCVSCGMQLSWEN